MNDSCTLQFEQLSNEMNSSRMSHTSPDSLKMRSVVEMSKSVKWTLFVYSPINMLRSFLNVPFNFGWHIKLQFDWMLVILVIDNFIISRLGFSAHKRNKD